MAMTLMIDNINNDFIVQPPETTGSNGSYYRFYQSKLRQLVTQTRYRKEQEARVARQKQSKLPSHEHRLSEQRLHKEYMNHIRERSKMQAQEILAGKLDESSRRAESVLSNITNQTVTLSISTGMESRPKYAVKSRLTPVTPKQQQQHEARIISTPTSSLLNVNKPKITPRKKIDYVEENLSKANIHSFTQVTSSSSLNSNHHHHYARKLILNTIMLHLKSHIPSPGSAYPTYKDIDQKFSSSIAPSVYQNFERFAA